MEFQKEFWDFQKGRGLYEDSKGFQSLRGRFIRLKGSLNGHSGRLQVKVEDFRKRTPTNQLWQNRFTPNAFV